MVVKDEMLKEWLKNMNEVLTEKWMDMSSFNVNKSASIMDGLGINNTDEALATSEPIRTRFYGEVQAAFRDDPDTLKKVLTIFNDHHLRSKLVHDRMDGIANNLKYLVSVEALKTGDKCKAVENIVQGTNQYLKTYIDRNGAITLQGDCTDGALAVTAKRKGADEDTKPEATDKDTKPEATKKGDAEEKEAEVDTSGGKKKQRGGNDKDATDYFEEKQQQILDTRQKIKDIEELPKEQQNLDELEKLRKTEKTILDEAMNHPAFNANVREVQAIDRVIFIALTYVVRALVLFLLDWGINSYFIDSFTTAFTTYIVMYTVLLAIVVMLVNVRSESGYENNFKLLFFYLNTDNGYGRIVVHFVLQWLLLPVMMIVKTNNTSGNNVTALDYEGKRKVYQVISKMTLFFWMLTSLIALRF